MIKLIGFKRMLALGIVVLINAALAAAFFLWVEPQRNEAQTNLRSLESEINGLRGKIVNIKEELETLQANMQHYEQMQERGFFMNQDRFFIEKVLTEMGDRAQIPRFSLSIGAIQEVPSSDATAAEHKLINSRVKVDNIEAFLDTDIYKFINWVNLLFPGQTRIHEVELRHADRTEFSNAAIERIAQGDTSATLIVGSVVFDWQTMVPLPKEEQNDGGNFRNRYFR